MKKYFVALCLLLILPLLGCAWVFSPVGNGLLFTSVKAPIDAEPGAATLRKGKACAHNILGLVAFGNASIEAAKRDGDITTPASVDGDAFSLLALYSKFCTEVRGE